MLQDIEKSKVPDTCQNLVENDVNQDIQLKDQIIVSEAILEITKLNIPDTTKAKLIQQLLSKD